MGGHDGTGAGVRELTGVDGSGGEFKRFVFIFHEMTLYSIPASGSVFAGS